MYQNFYFYTTKFIALTTQINKLDCWGINYNALAFFTKKVEIRLDGEYQTQKKPNLVSFLACCKF